MDAALAAFNAVLPAFFIIAIGAFANRLLTLDLATLSRLAIYFTLPALVFNAMLETSLSFRAASALLVAYLLYLLVLGVIAVLGAFGLSPIQKRALVVNSIFGNTGNMGLPITLFAYGQAGLERAVLVFVLSLLVMFALGPVLLSGSTSDVRKRVLEAVKLPPIWATLLGILFNFSNWQLPSGLAQGVTLLGDATIPIMLFALGLQMNRSWVWKLGSTTIRSLVLRLALGPIVAYFIGRMLALPGLDLQVLVLSAAMPTAVTMFVVAVEVKGDFEGVARAVVATTLGSLFAISLVIFLLPQTG